MRIAVLGLGRMGAPMARNLVEVGHQVTLYNRTHARALELGSTGARVASTVAEAVVGTQVALTMLADDAAEEALTFGPEGLLAHLPDGAIHLCMSTLGVETSRKLAAAHEAKGQGYVAAPVFGRPGAAASRRLWIVVGGPETQVVRCLPIFDGLGRGFTQVGSVPELAHAAKLGGDLLAVAMVEGLAEVLAYGEKAGLPPADFLRLLNTAIFRSPLLDSYGGLMVRHSFEPADLSLEQAAQEMRLALRSTKIFEGTLPMADLLERRLEAAEIEGFGPQDLSVLFRACRVAAGLEGTSAPRPQELPVSLAPWPKIAVPKALEPEVVPVPAPLPEKPEPPEDAKAPEATAATDIPAHPTPEEAPSPFPGIPPATYPATLGNGFVTLDVERTTHFEVIDEQVWAWHQEKRYRTPWRSLTEVEAAFWNIVFLRIQRHVLLQPATVLALEPLFGGRAKVRVGEHLELKVSWTATARLKELLKDRGLEGEAPQAPKLQAASAPPQAPPPARPEPARPAKAPKVVQGGGDLEHTASEALPVFLSAGPKKNRSQRKPKPVPTTPQAAPKRLQPPTPKPVPRVAAKAGSEENRAPAQPSSLLQGGPLATYSATSGNEQVILDLKRTTHFEVLDGQVWAWHQEQRYGTSWRSLTEVELVFRHVLFLRIQSHVLLQPETVQELKPVFGGRAKAKVGEHLELEVSRAAAPRLKELLGI
jgi:3-hydroxyisobutyrate dehydrogenase-like beta-hydroxyacid dehydrogenase/DNA-binding LytR/AlgR family response regulator